MTMVYAIVQCECVHLHSHVHSCVCGGERERENTYIGDEKGLLNNALGGMALAELEVIPCTLQS